MIATLIKRMTGTALLCLVGLTATPWQSPAAQTLPGTLPGTSSGSAGGLFGRSGFLPVDQAFSFYTAIPAEGTVMLHWQIAAEYYLYRDKFAVTVSYASPDSTSSQDQSEPPQPVALTLPEGVAHHDEYFGDVEVFYDTLAFQVPIPEAASAPITLIVHYQGCAEQGLCYPEQHREIVLEP